MREQDKFLPIANISRIMKEALPNNAKVSKDAKELVQNCVSDFIIYITSQCVPACVAAQGSLRLHFCVCQLCRCMYRTMNHTLVCMVRLACGAPGSALCPHAAMTLDALSMANSGTGAATWL